MGKPILFLLEHSGLQETELIQLPFGKDGFLKTMQGSNKQVQAVGTLQVPSSTCLLSSGPGLDRRRGLPTLLSAAQLFCIPIPPLLPSAYMKAFCGALGFPSTGFCSLAPITSVSLSK